MKLKKIITLLLVLVMMVSVIGCGQDDAGTSNDTDTSDNTSSSEGSATNDSETSEGEEVVLNVWHQWSNDTNELKRLYDEAVAEYEADHPNVVINTETLDTEAYKTKIAAEFAGSASGIDVFYYWGAGMARKLINADALLPLDEYITDEVNERILPGSTGAFEFNGQTYSVPMFSWYMTLFANKALFDQAGTEIPTTYEELVTASEKLSALEDVTPFAAGAKDGWNAAFIYQALALREVGGEDVNAMLRGDVPFSETGYRQAAEKVSALYEMGTFGRNPLESGNDDANSAFITGKAAMRLMGSWFANQVYTDTTATIDPDQVVAVNIPMVEGKGNASDYAGGFIESFWVNKGTSYPAEAAEFAIYINEKMGQAAYETGTGFSGWTGDFDESALNPLFIQIKELLSEGETGVLAWDTSLDSEPATIHNELVQTLFADGFDIDAFIEEHESAINQ
jgi:raffinose/stachyose/melibiose transport system substrate-binding protein